MSRIREGLDRGDRSTAATGPIKRVSEDPMESEAMRVLAEYRGEERSTRPARSPVIQELADGLESAIGQAASDLRSQIDQLRADMARRDRAEVQPEIDRLVRLRR